MAATTSVWHHPNFISAKNEYGRTVYKFKPFTGDEPEPWATLEAHSVRDIIVDNMRAEAEAAQKLWEAARYFRGMRQLLTDGAQEAKELTDAKARADAAYAALSSTEDGRWRAALLNLVQARETALFRAREWDRKAEEIAGADKGAYIDDYLDVRVPSMIQLADELGVPASDWMLPGKPDYDEHYRDYESNRDAETGEPVTLLQALLRKEFAEQDKAIRTVDRLSGGSAY